ncbi:hypothetical protein ACTWP5_23540 [Streptomyces sp. 4N509B]|uniref:hypothetical protein n=1 Tax=Streptomyces sp. 4N509B TaxID=3457413 RepID=UPI003FD56D10
MSRLRGKSKQKAQEKIRAGTPRQDLPLRIRRQLTYAHVQKWGVEALPEHPVPYRRWEPWVVVTVSLGLSVVVFGQAGIRSDPDSLLSYVVSPLIGVACWTVFIGPVLLYQSRRLGRTKRRMEEAARAAPVPSGRGPAIPWSSDEGAGLVSYGGDSLHLVSDDGAVTDIPFSEIHFVEELPPMGILGIPGIDVLTTAGHWTEIRVIDNTELIAALEMAGAPVVRARNHPFRNMYT